MECQKCGEDVRDWWMGLCAKCTSMAASDTIRGVRDDLAHVSAERDELATCKQSLQVEVDRIRGLYIKTDRRLTGMKGERDIWLSAHDAIYAELKQSRELRTASDDYASDSMHDENNQLALEVEQLTAERDTMEHIRMEIDRIYDAIGLVGDDRCVDGVIGAHILNVNAIRLQREAREAAKVDMARLAVERDNVYQDVLKELDRYDAETSSYEGTFDAFRDWLLVVISRKNSTASKGDTGRGEK